jgi:hypothetical protein
MEITINATTSIAPRKRVHLLKTVVGFFILVFIKTSIELVKMKYDLFCCIKNSTVFGNDAPHTEARDNENIYALKRIHTLSIKYLGASSEVFNLFFWIPD